MDHFPQMRILNHEQRHCNCIRLFIFRRFILCIHLFPMTGFRRIHCPPDFIGLNVYKGNCVRADGDGEAYVPCRRAIPSPHSSGR